LENNGIKNYEPTAWAVLLFVLARTPLALRETKFFLPLFSSSDFELPVSLRHRLGEVDVGARFEGARFEGADVDEYIGIGGGAMLSREGKMVASGCELGSKSILTLKSADARTGIGTEGALLFASRGAVSETDVPSGIVKLEDKGDGGDDEN
jgi:hypothetical protein